MSCQLARRRSPRPYTSQRCVLAPLKAPAIYDESAKNKKSSNIEIHSRLRVFLPGLKNPSVAMQLDSLLPRIMPVFLLSGVAVVPGSNGGW